VQLAAGAVVARGTKGMLAQVRAGPYSLFFIVPGGREGTLSYSRLINLYRTPGS